MNQLKGKVFATALITFTSLAVGGCQSSEQPSDGATPSTAPTASTQARPKCPVCNMYADMAPEWTAEISYADGTRESFDTPHHLFKLYFDAGTGEAEQADARRGNVTTMTVTDYSTKTPIDAKSAFFVVGSRVKSIMGDTLVPFQSRSAADAFAEEQGGRVIPFEGVTAETVKDMS